MEMDLLLDDERVKRGSQWLRTFLLQNAQEEEQNSQDDDKTSLSLSSIAHHDLQAQILDWAIRFLASKQCPEELSVIIARRILQDICQDEQILMTCRSQESGDNATVVYESWKLEKVLMEVLCEVCEDLSENLPKDLFVMPETEKKQVSVFAIKNSRRIMEDQHAIVPDLNLLLGLKEQPAQSFYAVFDGHAGFEAANYASVHLHHNIVKADCYHSDPVNAIKEGFLKTDEMFLQKAGREDLKSGTTAVCCLIRGKTLYVGWVGDSQAVLVRRGSPIELVNPHKPGRQDERDRIDSLGGCVVYFGTWRVNGSLAISRAIGDVSYKPLVSAEADVVETELDGSEDFIILGCDGLWDVQSPAEAALHVYNYVQQDPGNAKDVASKLVLHAKVGGSSDNITVIVVFLRDVLDLHGPSPSLAADASGSVSKPGSTVIPESPFDADRHFPYGYPEDSAEANDLFLTGQIHPTTVPDLLPQETNTNWNITRDNVQPAPDTLPECLLAFDSLPSKVQESSGVQITSSEETEVDFQIAPGTNPFAAEFTPREVTTTSSSSSSHLTYENPERDNLGFDADFPDRELNLSPVESPKWEPLGQSPCEDEAVPRREIPENQDPDSGIDASPQDTLANIEDDTRDAEPVHEPRFVEEPGKFEYGHSGFEETENRKLSQEDFEKLRAGDDDDDDLLASHNASVVHTQSEDSFGSPFGAVLVPEQSDQHYGSEFVAQPDYDPFGVSPGFSEELQVPVPETEPAGHTADIDAELDSSHKVAFEDLQNQDTDLVQAEPELKPEEPSGYVADVDAYLDSPQKIDFEDLSEKGLLQNPCAESDSDAIPQPVRVEAEPELMKEFAEVESQLEKQMEDVDLELAEELVEIEDPCAIQQPQLDVKLETHFEEDAEVVAPGYPEERQDAPASEPHLQEPKVEIENLEIGIKEVTEERPNEDVAFDLEVKGSDDLASGGETEPVTEGPSRIEGEAESKVEMPDVILSNGVSHEEDGAVTRKEAAEVLDDDESEDGDEWKFYRGDRSSTDLSLQQVSVQLDFSEQQDTSVPLTSHEVTQIIPAPVAEPEPVTEQEPERVSEPQAPEQSKETKPEKSTAAAAAKVPTTGGAPRAGTGKPALKDASKGGATAAAAKKPLRAAAASSKPLSAATSRAAPIASNRVPTATRQPAPSVPSAASAAASKKPAEKVTTSGATAAPKRPTTLASAASKVGDAKRVPPLVRPPAARPKVETSSRPTTSAAAKRPTAASAPKPLAAPKPKIPEAKVTKDAVNKEISSNVKRTTAARTANGTSTVTQRVGASSRTVATKTAASSSSIGSPAAKLDNGVKKEAPKNPTSPSKTLKISPPISTSSPKRAPSATASRTPTAAAARTPTSASKTSPIRKKTTTPTSKGPSASEKKPIPRKASNENEKGALDAAGKEGCCGVGQVIRSPEQGPATNGVGHDHDDSQQEAAQQASLI